MLQIKSNRLFYSAIVFIILLMIAVPVFAEENPVCDKLGGIAIEIMKYRQEGVSYSAMMGVAVKNDARNGTELEQVMVTYAFTYPRIYDLEAREQVIYNFGKKMYDICNKNNPKKQEDSVKYW